MQTPNMILRWRRAPIEARPTQPPQPLRIVDVPVGYPEDLETFGTPVRVNVEDILSVDVTPRTSISISGMGVTFNSCPDMYVAVSKSVDLGTSMSVDFDDRAREIQDTATSSFMDNPVYRRLCAVPKSFRSYDLFYFGHCQSLTG